MVFYHFLLRIPAAHCVDSAHSVLKFSTVAHRAPPLGLRDLFDGIEWFPARKASSPRDWLIL